MSHSDVFNVDEVEWRIHHNGDYSGNVRLIAPEGQVLRYTDYSNASEDKYYEVTIPFEVLRNFVLDKFRKDMISDIESATYDNLYRWLKASIGE